MKSISDGWYSLRVLDERGRVTSWQLYHGARVLAKGGSGSFELIERVVGRIVRKCPSPAITEPDSLRKASLS